MSSARLNKIKNKIHDNSSQWSFFGGEMEGSIKSIDLASMTLIFIIIYRMRRPI